MPAGRCNTLPPQRDSKKGTLISNHRRGSNIYPTGRWPRAVETSPALVSSKRPLPTSGEVTPTDKYAAM